MDGHKFFQPHFKPDYNPDLLCTVNYICHLFVVDRKVIDKVGMLRSEFDGAQDYDFIFRCIEAVDPSEIYHISRFCITGDAMRILQLRIRKAKLTHSRQENVQLRHIMREPASMQKFIRENFWDFTGQDLFVTMIADLHCHSEQGPY